MTVDAINKTALALIFEDVNTIDYDPYLFIYLNLLLQQNFTKNNQYRMSKGLTPLESAQVVTSKSDILLYEPDLCLEVLTYGLGAMFIKEDDMMSDANGKNYYDLITQYTQAQNKYNKAVYVDVEDIYSCNDEVI
ncbi:hypothetical protein [Clostridium sp. BNL1100]|uniref:hypothetical protein n=1 Tax=Clostridium sp. BNL1100 TaxID=755731 RepID=UPI00024A7A93|nr:hypothetical protein [Clostridium sp. BNL1100]AEY66603.1 hypothetical protein Clo1100_2432 [Clostridium sp. BNL1100]